MKKRFLSVVLIALLVFSLFAGIITADDNTLGSLKGRRNDRITLEDTRQFIKDLFKPQL